MPRQRFIHPEFWTDPSVGRLTPIERLFFIGCFSNADDEGRLLGNPAYLRSIIFPYDDLTIEQVKQIRDRVVSICKNLVLYEVDGQEYLAFLKWSRYQKPKYPKPSKLPAPPGFSGEEANQDTSKDEIGETFPQNRGNDGENLEQDLPHGMGLGRDGFGMGMGRDGEGNPQPPSGGSPTDDATERERAILHELKQVPGFPDDYSKNLAFIRTLAVDFPSLDLLEQAKKWRVYKLDKPLTKKSNARLQFRNWCEIAAKRQVNADIATRASPKRIPRAFASLDAWAREGEQDDQNPNP